MQDAGAAAIELNIYYLPGDPHISGRDVEQRHLDILARVKDAVTVPVAVKLSPYFSSTGEMALRLDQAGADGLVLFNRFLQPDIDPETLAVVAGVRPVAARPRRGCRATWIALLRGRVRASLAATTGVEGSTDVDQVPAGRRGRRDDRVGAAAPRPGVRGRPARRVAEWMGRKGYATVDDFRGLLAVPVGVDETARERGDYVSALRKANRSGSGSW